MEISKLGRNGVWADTSIANKIMLLEKPNPLSTLENLSEISLKGQGLFVR